MYSPKDNESEEHSSKIGEQVFENINPSVPRDMTMDSSFGLGYRSPCIGMSSPGPGRTVREYEEHMDALRKENFNLKLKIYVLEEKLPSLGEISTPEGQESLMKQYVENKLDTEILKNDLEYKKELLQEAAAAINHLEYMLKQSDEKNSQMVDDLKRKIQYLEHENKILEKGSKSSFISGDEDSKIAGNVLKVQELEMSPKDSEEKVRKVLSQIKKLEEENLEKDKMVELFKNKNQKLKSKIKDLEEVIEIKENIIQTNDSKKIQNDLDKSRSELANKMCELDDLQEKFAKQGEDYEKGLKYIEKLIEVTTVLKSENEELRKELENGNKNNISNKSIKKCVSDKKLQNEIEILSKQLVSAAREAEDNKLVADQAKNEAEKAYQLSTGIKEVCNVLTVRLEELAGFLDSLLKQKDILNVIAPDKKREIQDAVNKSLDLSRSFAAESLSITNLSFDETNLAQLSNLTGILENSRITNKLNVFKDKHFYGLKHKCESFQDKRGATPFSKAEFQISKTNNISCPIECTEHHELEFRSKPDYEVSFARSGLSHPIKLVESQNQFSDESDGISLKSDSNTGLLSKSERNKCVHKIAQYEKIIIDKDNKVLEIQCQLVESDNRLKKQNILLTETINKLQENTERMRNLETELETFKNSVDISKANEERLKQELKTKDYELNKTQEKRDKLKKKLEESDLKTKEKTKKLEEDLEKVKKNERSLLEEINYKHKKELDKNIQELKLQHQETLNNNWVQKTEYMHLLEQTKALELKLKNSKDLTQNIQESELNIKEQLIKSEEIIQSLQKNINEYLLSITKTELEKTEIISEKLNLENYIQELLGNCESLRNENDLLIDQVNSFLNKQSDIDNGEQNIVTDFEENRRLEIVSPDLGIESDTGRTANDDVKTKTNNQENEQTASNMAKESAVNNSNTIEKDVGTSKLPTDHKCEEIYNENLKLREKYKLVAKMNKEMLKVIRKKHDHMEQFERNIIIQIKRTNEVLEYARNNFTNNSKLNI